MKQTVNERVKAIRQALRLNQVEFANELGISPSLISKLEVGEKASANTLDAVIKTYSVPEEWLLSGKGEMSYRRPEKKTASTFDPATDTLYNELRDQIQFLRDIIRDMRPRATNFPTALNGTGFRKKSLRAAA